MSTLLVSERGEPLPPSDVVRRLQGLDPALSLAWHPVMACWSLKWTWPAGDVRWARVQSGEISEAQAFDVFAFLPKDCAADEAMAYLEKHLERADRSELRRLYEKTMAYNEAHKKKLAEQQVVEAVEQTERDLTARKRGTRGAL